jgi:hypothetical protein
LLTTRPVSPDDLEVALRLLDDADRWLMSVSIDEAAGLLAGAPALLLLAGDRPRGIILSDWPHETVAWLRLLALSGGVSTTRAIDTLLPPFHQTLRARGVAHIYTACADPGDSWAMAALRNAGYTHDTDVIVYEKVRMMFQRRQPDGAGTRSDRRRHTGDPGG